MWKRVAIALSLLALLAAMAMWRDGSSGDSAEAPSSSPPPASSLFVQPRGSSIDACGAYVATWLDLLHSEDGFPINELKADLGQGPLWVAVTDTWRRALDLERAIPREDVARRLVPTIAASCADPDVRAQFLQLQSGSSSTSTT